MRTTKLVCIGSSKSMPGLRLSPIDTRNSIKTFNSKFIFISSYTRLELLQCLLALWLATTNNASLSDKFLFLLFTGRTLRTMFDWTLWWQRDHWRHFWIDIIKIGMILSNEFRNYKLTGYCWKYLTPTSIKIQFFTHRDYLT